MTLLAAESERAAVAAIIVTYNSADTLTGLLDSLEKSTVDLRAIVVDNGSRDDTLSVARRHPAVTVIATGANLGYSGGINVGRRFVKVHECVAILNPDLVVAPDAIELMLKTLEDRSVGIVAPQLEDLEGGHRFDSLRREPSVWRAFGDSLFGNRLPSRPGWFAETLRRDSDYASVRDVAWAGGAALLISAECNRVVGRWDDETYFLYSEETDYARRARDLGFRVRYQPAALARHVGSGSGQPAPLVALISVNRVRYFERLHGRVRTFFYQVAVAVQHLLRLHDARHRYSVPFVLNRTRWHELPSGDPTPPELRATDARSPSEPSGSTP